MSWIMHRYGRAVGSTNLKADCIREAADIDVVIAVGWTHHTLKSAAAPKHRRKNVDGLAEMLYRLRVEFDGIDKRGLQRAQRLVEKTEQRLRNAMPLKADEHGGAAVLLYTLYQFRVARYAYDTEILSATSRMRSFPPVRAALRKFVSGAAARKGITLSSSTVIKVVTRVLYHFLDPLCPACRGVKFKVIQNTGRLSTVTCHACSGTGKKGIDYLGGVGQMEFELTRDVQDALERKMNNLDRLVAGFLRR